MNPLGIIDYLPPRRINRHMRQALRLLRVERGNSRADSPAVHLNTWVVGGSHDRTNEDLLSFARPKVGLQLDDDSGATRGRDWHNAYYRRDFDELARARAVTVYHAMLRRAKSMLSRER